MQTTVWLLMDQIGWLAYPLAACSVISLTIICERCVFWIRYLYQRNYDQLRQCLQLIRHHKLDEALAFSRTKSHPLFRIYTFVLTHPTTNTQHQNDHLYYACNRELKQMKSRSHILVTIITIAPLLGILGTIIGIISAFQGLSGNVPNPAIMSHGISQALWTTAIGLSITISTLIPYYFFQSRIVRAQQELEDWGTRFEHACAHKES